MIVVTGSSGVLGTALLDELRVQGSEVCAVRSSDVDLRDFEATFRFFSERRPHTIYHAAARVHGLMGNRMFPCDVYTDNIRINTSVIDAARRVACKRFIAISTVAIYPDTKTFPITEGMVFTGPPHEAEKGYAHSKRAMLGHLEVCKAQYGMDFTYAILTNLFGPNDRFDEVNGHVVPSLISKFYRAAREGGPVTVWGSGLPRRDMLFSKDAAVAIHRAGQQYSGPINIATGVAVPIMDVVECLSRISGVSDVTWDTSKPDGQLERNYDVSRLSGLEFRCRFSLEEGLRRTYEWYAENFPNVRK